MANKELDNLIEEIIEAVLERTIVIGIGSCCANGDVYAVVDEGHYGYQKDGKSDYDNLKGVLKELLKPLYNGTKTDDFI